MASNWYDKAVKNLITYPISRNKERTFIGLDGMNIVKYDKWNYVWNFKFRKCEFTEAVIYPFTKVYKGRCANNAGALFGGPTAYYDVYTTKEIFVKKALAGELS